MLFARRRKHSKHVLAIGRIHYVIVGVFCVPHTKAVVVLRCKADVFHARFLGKQHPLFGIVIHGIKALV